jgi:hypothetical protein
MSAASSAQSHELNLLTNRVPIDPAPEAQWWSAPRFTGAPRKRSVFPGAECAGIGNKNTASPARAAQRGIQNAAPVFMPLPRGKAGQQVRMPSAIFFSPFADNFPLPAHTHPISINIDPAHKYKHRAPSISAFFAEMGGKCATLYGPDQYKHQLRGLRAACAAVSAFRSL